MTPRNQFIGVYVSSDLKKDLVDKAVEQNVSLSLLVNQFLFEGLGQTPVLETRPRTMSGRPTAKRVRAHPEFLSALMMNKSPDNLAKKSGLRPWTMDCVMRGNKFAITTPTLLKLQKLASLIGYKGELTQ